MEKARKKSYFRAREMGRAIKRLRQLAGKSQGEVADETGLSIQAISNIEVGRVMPDLDSLCSIAEGIGVEPHMLIKHGVSKGSAEQLADRAEAIAILSGLDPSATKLALEQLRAVLTWRRSMSGGKEKA
jgi:transcriptional regulator with XRE-family HTH domain